MDRQLAIRTINRCEELGVFDMKCLKLEYRTEAEKLKALVDLLMPVDTNSFKPEIKKYILMDDDAFELRKFLAKMYVKKFDRDHCKDNGDPFWNLKLF